MRKFYIFNISKEFITLNRKSPYNLFKTFESIFYSPMEEQNYNISIYEEITKPIEKDNINKLLFDAYHNNDHYTKYQNIHLYNNYYSDETTKLKIGKAFILLETTAYKPTFMNKLVHNGNYFVCDFENKDYFWLENVA